MRKYGIEHFHIELIEETDNPKEREVFWIENKRSFKNGYNSTEGGQFWSPNIHSEEIETKRIN